MESKSKSKSNKDHLRQLF